MREILFRGKSVNDGRWLFGDLSNYGDCKTIATTKGFSIVDNSEVIPETVGQYTGLTDKNGRKIFEWDILHLKGENEEDYWRAIVVFGNPNGNYSWGWQLQNITPNVCVNPDILLWVETELNYVSCEVIGNVCDNPELLGGEKNG